MTHPATPAWIIDARKRSTAWVLEDVDLTLDEWESLTYEQLLDLPLVKQLHLNPSGGRTRFPGSEIQDVTFGFWAMREVKHHGGVLNQGETVSGNGKTLPDAVRSAIQVVVELLSLRGDRP